MESKQHATEGKESAAHRKHHPVLLGSAFATLLVVFIILIWDWNWFKPPIERRVSAATGRSFHIDGDLSVKLAWKPRVSMERLRLGNLPGNHEPEMASVGLLQF